MKLLILKNKGNIFYFDTDSIVTHMTLPDHMLDYK